MRGHGLIAVAVLALAAIGAMTAAHWLAARKAATAPPPIAPTPASAAQVFLATGFTSTPKQIEDQQRAETVARRVTQLGIPMTAEVIH